MPEVSIVVSARDSFSPSIKNMTNNIKGFSKETEEAAKEIQNLEKKQDSLYEQQAKLRINMDELKSSLSAARKEFKLTGDEVSRLDYEKAIIATEKGSTAYRNNTKAIRENDTALHDLQGTQSKGGNRAGTDKSILSSLAAAGFTKMAGDVMAQGANFYVSSAFGSDIGSMFGSALSGAASGAAMGAMMAGPAAPIGAVIGGVAGGAIGLASGGMSVAQRQDDAFKGAVQDVYSRLTQENVSMVESGIPIASGREMDAISYAKLYGSKELGDSQLGWIKDTANATPFLYEDLKSLDKTLVTYGYNAEESQKRLLQIGDTGAALNMNSQDMAMVATGLGRMKSTDKTTMEYMNLLIERGIDATGYLAEAYGKSKGEISEAISKGQIKGSEAADIVANLMGRDYAGSMEEMSKTFGGLTSTLQGWQQEIQAAAGKGFMNARSPALEQQNEHYDIMGNKYEEAAGVSGKLEAIQQNRQERILRNTMNELFTQNEAYSAGLEKVSSLEQALFKKQEAGENFDKEEDALAAALADLQKMIDVAEGSAEQQYMGTEIEKSLQSANGKLLDSLRGFLKEDNVWKMWSYNMGIEMGYGMMSVQPENAMVSTDVIRSTHSDAWGMDYLPANSSNQPAIPRSTHNSAWGMDYLPPKAFGQSFVPYDNFPALLHQGERVLTASEARAADRGGTSPVTVTGNNFSVREEADIDKIALALAQQLMKARVSYAP